MSPKKSPAKKRGTKARTKPAASARKRNPTRARKRLDVRREKRGLTAGEVALALDSPEVAGLADSIRRSGGTPLTAYRDPLSGRPLVLASLLIETIEPTPFQRDLSPAHTKRLAQKIEESGSFLDPIIVVQGPSGRFWTPNGRHRLAAAKVLGLRLLTGLVSPDETLAYRILALNTEKAHNLKDRSLEVIRMARALAAAHPRARESEYAAQFEAPELLTLGLVYLENARFAGGAYSAFLKKVDRFAEASLPRSLAQREGFAARLLQIDRRVTALVEALRARGMNSPYLRNLVVARINPVRFHRAKKGETAPAMPLGAALTRMAASARTFDVRSVRAGDLALVAAIAPAED